MAARADHGLPQTFVGLCELMATHKATMPRRIRQAAIFVVGHPDDIAFLPIAVLAARAGLYPSVFARLAQHIGYAGFSQVQAIARRRLVSPGDDGACPVGSDALSRAIRDAQASLARFDGKVDRGRLARAADALAGAHTVFLVGTRCARFATGFLGHLFTISGVRTMAASGHMGPSDGTLGFASDADAAIVVDFCPADPLLVSQVPELRRRGVPVVLLTDTRSHPLADPDGLWFEALQDAAFGLRGWGVLECFGLALVEEVSCRRRAEAGEGAARASGPRPRATSRTVERAMNDV